MILPPLPAYGLPKRAEVEQLCHKINYHPLSLKVLAFQLKNNSINTLSERLDSFLRELPSDMAQSEKSLLASLNLFLENLESQMLPYLLKLGIFQDGAFENVLQGIINIPEVLWQKLRQNLEASGFMQAENIEGVTVPYLKFHPAITPRLWAMLPSKEQQALKKRYCQGYYEFSSFLYEQDNKNPYQARAIEQRELSNLLQALHDTRGEEWSPHFANKVKSFLVDFGLITDRDVVVDTEKTSPTQSQDWFIARTEEAEQLYSTGDYQEAQTKFQEILEQLGETNKSDRCVALGWLGRCMAEQENLDEASDSFQQGLEELEELESSPQVKQETGYMQSYLGAVLKEKGDISDAKQAYEGALPIMQEMGETQTEAVIQDQLGTLEMLQGNLPKAERYHRDALKRMQPLNILKLEAQSLQNLGTVYQKAKHWKAAAEAYQKAANLFEEQEDAAGAAQNWALFAQMSQKANNLTDTEKGYRKAIEKYKAVENWSKLSSGYRNLAELP
ncbi:TPR repeat protein [Candidatus Thiomargarita nelsonii]|uniref:TPR repeat protein n=1 Tax=Candidatus Thiomargarita nelsonii TaxID=1003181 RepID=A0A176RTC1_9GAMM|nr:TPR repeat protein [Candidatus Thiomargarita nelsonii]